MLKMHHGPKAGNELVSFLKKIIQYLTRASGAREEKKKYFIKMHHGPVRYLNYILVFGHLACSISLLSQPILYLSIIRVSAASDDMVYTLDHGMDNSSSKYTMGLRHGPLKYLNHIWSPRLPNRFAFQNHPVPK